MVPSCNLPLPQGRKILVYSKRNPKGDTAHVRRNPTAANAHGRAEPWQPVCAHRHRLHDGLRRSAPDQLRAWRNLHDRHVHRLLRHFDVLPAVVCDLCRHDSGHGAAGHACRAAGLSPAAQRAAHIDFDFSHRRIVFSAKSGDSAFRRPPADLSADSAVHGCARHRRRVFPASVADCARHRGGAAAGASGFNQAHENRSGHARRLPRL